MSEMVERIARVLEPQAWAALGTGDTLAYKNRRTSSMRKARAAIEVMLETISSQLAEVLSKPETHGKYSGQRMDDPYLWSSILTDIIDAALSEKP